MKTLCSAVVGTVALVVLLNNVSSAPVSRTTAEANKKLQAANFFLKYGYIVERSDESRPTLHIKKAIRDLQKFGGLPVTGQLDQATLKLIGTKRCGMKDPVKKVKRVGAIQNQVGEFYLQGTFWKKTYLTYRFVRGKSTGDLPVDVQQNIIRRMIHKWDEASALTIREADPSIPDDKVDILISFVEGYHGDPYPFDGTGGTLAHAFYPHNNKGLSGDAHFDDAERFTTGTKDGINLDWVALHEVGHSLGLEHSNVRESVMYPWYKGYQGSNIELTNDDILGIRALYPVKRPVTKRPETKKPTKPTRAPRTTPSTQPPPTDPPTPTAIHPACKPGTKYDAVVMERDRRGKFHTHFFHREMFWTLNERLQRGRSRRVSDYWPDVRTPIDAAYRNGKGNIVFFTGNKYWEYGNNRRLIGSGSLDRYGLSSDLTDMDAVFTWHRNKKTYFFKGEKYWRYNEAKRRIDPYYPREIRQGWPGLVKKDIDAAVTWRNTRSYIFSGEKYFRLQNKATGRMVYNDRGYPQITADKWMKCNDVGAIGALQTNKDI